MDDSEAKVTNDKVNGIFSILEGITNEKALFIISVVLGYLLRYEDDVVIEASLDLVNDFVRESKDVLKKECK